jgi:hypothetical protein
VNVKKASQIPRQLKRIVCKRTFIFGVNDIEIAIDGLIRIHKYSPQGQKKLGILKGTARIVAEGFTS